MTTARLALDELTQNQSEPHVPINSALNKLDWLVQLKALSIVTAPPGSPTAGDVHIVGASGSGAFSGHDHTIARYSGTAWAFLTPGVGWSAYIEDLGLRYECVTVGSAWSQMATGVSGAINRKRWIEYFDDLLWYPGSATGVGAPWDVTFSGTGASNAQADGIADGSHAGVVRMTTGTTNSGYVCMSLGYDVAGTNYGNFVVDADKLTYETLIMVDSVPTNAENYTTFVGLSDTYSAGQAVYCCIEYETGTGASRWILETRSTGGGTQRAIAATGPSAATWHHVKIEVTSALVTLYIDGASVATQATGANIPTKALTPRFSIFKTAGTTARILYADLVWIYKYLSADRHANLSGPIF